MNDPTPNIKPITAEAAESWLGLHGTVSLANDVMLVLIRSGEAEFGLNEEGQLVTRTTPKGIELLEALAAKLDRDQLDAIAWLLGPRDRN